MEEKIRLNKYLSEIGFCSRREADRLISEGRVFLCDRQAFVGEKIGRDEEIYVDGKGVKKEEQKVLLAYYKPKGIVCTSQKKEKHNVIDALGYPIRVYPVGRLDKDSRGLLLLTNQGELVNQMMRSRNGHEKKYIVTVRQKIKEEFLKGMARGVPILSTVTKKCTVEKIADDKFRIILTQGLNRQIRRMCEYFGYQVEDLKRVRIMNIKLGNLMPGQFREIEGKEMRKLLSLLKASSSERIIQKGAHPGMLERDRKE